MTNASKEKVLMAKSLKDVDGPWETIAFLYTWRRRETYQTLFFISFALNVFMLAKYTSFFQYLIKRFL